MLSGSLEAGRGVLILLYEPKDKDTMSLQDDLNRIATSAAAIGTGQESDFHEWLKQLQAMLSVVSVMLEDEIGMDSSNPVDAATLNALMRACDKAGHRIRQADRRASKEGVLLGQRTQHWIGHGSPV